MTQDKENAPDDRRLAALLAEVGRDGLKLLRQEARLARQETLEKLPPAARSTGMILGGGVMSTFGSVCILQAGVRALATRMPLWQASLLSGGVLTVSGILLVGRGGRQLRNLGIVPQKAINSLKEDKEWLIRQIKSRLT